MFLCEALHMISNQTFLNRYVYFAISQLSSIVNVNPKSYSDNANKTKDYEMFNKIYKLVMNNWWQILENIDPGSLIMSLS